MGASLPPHEELQSGSTLHEWVHRCRHMKKSSPAVRCTCMCCQAKQARSRGGCTSSYVSCGWCAPQHCHAVRAQVRDAAAEELELLRRAQSLAGEVRSRRTCSPGSLTLGLTSARRHGWVCVACAVLACIPASPQWLVCSATGSQRRVCEWRCCPAPLRFCVCCTTVPPM